MTDPNPPGQRMERQMAELLRQQAAMQRHGGDLPEIDALALALLPAALHRLGRLLYHHQTDPAEPPVRAFWLDIHSLLEMDLHDFIALIHEGRDDNPILIHGTSAHNAAEELARRLVPLLAARIIQADSIEAYWEKR